MFPASACLPPAQIDESCEDEDIDIDDLMSDLLVREQIWFDELPDRVLEFAVEGWLRMELSAATNVDDVLCSGYDVRFSAREFVAWFVRDLVPRV